MTELETLLLRQLEQQQHDSEQLVNGLSEQLDRLQTALNEQHAESRALRRELEHSDQQNAELIERLTERVDALTTLLDGLKTRLSKL
ncbi:hypothetical protein [Halomonas smyrnensis]|uniref:hypothetical protein n=1 Tax=Halomonas smyrnensis TaxID=720605 RepID=UPI000370C5AC|nr:hypothetical protein [Halomonas smyrnensis]